TPLPSYYRIAGPILSRGTFQKKDLLRSHVPANPEPQPCSRSFRRLVSSPLPWSFRRIQKEHTFGNSFPRPGPSAGRPPASPQRVERDPDLRSSIAASISRQS